MYVATDLCYINQINGNSQVSCALSSQWPCALGKKYYGRGPLQISWNFNYGLAGQSIGFDLLGTRLLIYCGLYPYNI